MIVVLLVVYSGGGGSGGGGGYQGVSSIPTTVGFLDTLKRWLGSGDVDADARPEAQADADRLAYDRDSIRVSQQIQARGAGGAMAPTPDVLHPEGDDR